MKIQGKIILATCLSMGLVSGAAAYTVGDYTIDDGTNSNPGADQFIGQNTNVIAANNLDVYGNPDLYEVFGMNVASDLTNLYVDVYTNFDATESGFDYGDLFISTDGWTPFGSAPYKDDGFGVGETWEYAVDVSERSGGGLADLVDVGKSNGLVTSGTEATTRVSQEVTVSRNAPVDKVGDAGFSISTGAMTKLSFEVALSKLGLSATTPQEIGLRWTMTCANDITEGSYTVPEPGTLALLGLGLLGFGMRKRVKS